MATSQSVSSPSLLCKGDLGKHTAGRRQPVTSITSSFTAPISSTARLCGSYITPFRPGSNLLVRAAPVSTSSPRSDREEVFFDGGPHIGDLLANLVFGLTLIWLPLTLASVFRALFLRYRFTNLRVTVISGLTGSDRKDFSYKVIQDVKYVPRLVGEWGDVVITLSDGTQVELKSVPKFREIAQYCLERAGKETSAGVGGGGGGGKGVARV